MKTELESQQNKLKDNLVKEKGEVTREERSRVQVRIDSEPKYIQFSFFYFFIVQSALLAL